MERTKILICMALAALLPLAACAPTVLDYRFEIAKNGTLLSHEFATDFGSPAVYVQRGGDYKVVITDAAGAALFERTYNIQFFVLGDPPMAIDKTMVQDKVSYTESMKKIKLLKGETVLFEGDLSFCNSDGVCDANENYLSCPADCPLDKPDGMCIKNFDGTCDPDCLTGLDPDCTCGDGTCQDYESPVSCPADCKAATDSFCNTAEDGQCDKDCPDRDPDCVPKLQIEAPITSAGGADISAMLVILAIVSIAAFAVYFVWRRKRLRS